VEAQNFGTRKHLLEYDDVMNKQRENVYALRRELLEGQIKLEDEVVDTRTYLMMLAEDLAEQLVETHANKEQDPQEWDLGALVRGASELFGIESEALEALNLAEQTPDAMVD